MKFWTVMVSHWFTWLLSKTKPRCLILSYKGQNKNSQNKKCINGSINKQLKINLQLCIMHHSEEILKLLNVWSKIKRMLIYRTSMDWMFCTLLPRETSLSVFTILNKKIWIWIPKTKGARLPCTGRAFKARKSHYYIYWSG
jgi:hypothetical protein